MTTATDPHAEFRAQQAEARAWNARVDAAAREWAASHGMKPATLSAHNVGRILKGIPAELRERYARNDDLLGADAARNARDERRAIIRDLVVCKGWMDHGDLFSRDGQPCCLVGHPYGLDGDELRALVRVARLWGLEWSASTAGSWYAPGETLQVVLWQPGAVAIPIAP